MVAMELPLVPQCLAHNANLRKKILWKKFSIFKAHVLYFMFSIFSSYCSKSDEVFISTNQ